MSRRRTTKVLQQIVDQCDEGQISIRDFTVMMGDRAFALVILVFSLPNSLPIPGIPGFSTITGLPILFIGLQMIIGKETIWLPNKVAEKKFSKATLRKILTVAIPYVRKIEVLLKPRLDIVLSPVGERVLGVFIVGLACLLSLPIPGGNFLPGLSISILALSFLEKDGAATLFGMLFAALSTFLMFEFLALVVNTMTEWFAHLFDM